MRLGIHLLQRTIGLIGVVLLALATITGPGASAQSESGSLVIYAYACPAGFTGTAYDECRATPLPGVGYTAFEAGQDNGIGATTDADGVASISLDPIGDGTVNVFVTPPAGYESVFVACSQEYGAIEGGITFAWVAQDAFITCEWYFVPVGGDPTPTPGTGEDPTPTPRVTGLPNTGSGSTDAGEATGRPVGAVAVLGVLGLGAACVGCRRAVIRRA